MFEAGMIAICVGFVISMIAGIWYLVAAFRESVAWGLGVWLVPFVSIAFFFMHFARAWKPAATSVVALILVIGGAFATYADPEMDAKMTKTFNLVNQQVDLSQYPELAEAEWLDSVTNQIAVAKGELDNLVEIPEAEEALEPVAPAIPHFTDEELIGLSQDEVLVKLGKPSGTGKGRGGMFWMYADYILNFADGYIVSDVTHEDAAALSANSMPLPPASPMVPVSTATAPAAAPARPAVTVVSNGGQRVDLGEYIGKGKVTIVDFYADWCGPCKKVDPALRQLAEGDADVELVKINIVKWGTPVTTQHRITSVPNMMVFDARGKQVGKAVPDFRLLRRYVKQAKDS